MDAIRITDLRLDAHVGVTEEERATAQRLVVQVELRLDLSAAARSDDLTETVDYGLLVERIANLVTAEPALLLERIAGRILEELSALKGVQGVTVEIAKVNPPIDRELGGASVRLERDA
jgi:dihydroneopterin aldolase